MVTTWLRFTMSSFSAYDTIVSLFDFGCKSTTHFLIVQVFGYKSFFFLSFVQGASLFIYRLAPCTAC